MSKHKISSVASSNESIASTASLNRDAQEKHGFFSKVKSSLARPAAVAIAPHLGAAMAVKMAATFNFGLPATLALAAIAEDGPGDIADAAFLTAFGAAIYVAAQPLLAADLAIIKPFKATRAAWKDGFDGMKEEFSLLQLTRSEFFAPTPANLEARCEAALNDLDVPEFLDNGFGFGGGCCLKEGELEKPESIRETVMRLM